MRGVVAGRDGAARRSAARTRRKGQPDAPADDGLEHAALPAALAADGHDGRQADGGVAERRQRLVKPLDDEDELVHGGKRRNRDDERMTNGQSNPVP